MRRLIINADDLGYTRGVNRAIAECAAAGAITSATLMAQGRAFEEAATLAKRIDLAVGCHVVLVDGEPCEDPGTIPSLLDGREFRGSIVDLAKTSITGAVDADEVKREARAQFKKIRMAGISVTHFDTHKHAHMFPAIFKPLLAVAKEEGIGAVRNPFEPFSVHWIASPALWLRGAETTAMRSFRESFVRAVTDLGLKTTQGTVGIAVTGRLDATWLRRMIQALEDGTWELVCHPGYADDDLRAANTRLRDSREVELEALTSDEFRSLLQQEKIELITYADL